MFARIRRLNLPFSIAPIKVPIIDWLPQYNKNDLIYDIISGCTVFVFLIPQGMAYALLAGMPPEYGLYSAIAPLYIYSLLGSSKHLSLGPMAITSLLLGQTCHSFGLIEATPSYIDLALNISMVVGIITFFIGIFKLGLLINLISPSVLSGFLTGSALVIIINQLKYILGLKAPRLTYTHEIIYYLLTHLHQSNPYSLLIGIFALVTLSLIREWRRKYNPTPERLKSILYKLVYILCNLSSLLSIIIGALCAMALLQHDKYILVIGHIPAGLKPPSFHLMNIDELLKLVPSACAISFVGFSGNWAIATKYANQFKYQVDATQELIANGLTIMLGVVFNSFIVSGGLARTAVNVESGAKSQISGCITATLMIFAVLFTTSWFYYIPMCVLAAIIQVSVMSMLDFQEMYHAYKINKNDCFVMVVTFLVTFFLGVTEGLIVGIFISIMMILHVIAFPRVVHLGKLPEEEGGHYRNILRFPQARQIPGIAIIRMDASLSFSNCNYFQTIVMDAAHGKYHTSNEKIRQIIIDASAWIDCDLSGIKILAQVEKDLREFRLSVRNVCDENDINYTRDHVPGITFSLACSKGSFRDRLRNSQIYQIFRDKLYMSIDEAVFKIIPRCSSYHEDELTGILEQVRNNINPLHPNNKHNNNNNGLEMVELSGSFTDRNASEYYTYISNDEV
eukprot:gene14775-19856_t